MRSWLVHYDHEHGRLSAFHKRYGRVSQRVGRAPLIAAASLRNKIRERDPRPDLILDPSARKFRRDFVVLGALQPEPEMAG